MEVTVSGSCAVTTEDIRVIWDLRVLEGTCTEKKSVCKSNNNSNSRAAHMPPIVADTWWSFYCQVGNLSSPRADTWPPLCPTPSTYCSGAVDGFRT